MPTGIISPAADTRGGYRIIRSQRACNHVWCNLYDRRLQNVFTSSTRIDWGMKNYGSGNYQDSTNTGSKSYCSCMCMYRNEREAKKEKIYLVARNCSNKARMRSRPSLTRRKLREWLPLCLTVLCFISLSIMLWSVSYSFDASIKSFT